MRQSQSSNDIARSFKRLTEHSSHTTQESNGMPKAAVISTAGVNSSEGIHEPRDGIMVTTDLELRSLDKMS